jgi:hypothetical protein
VRTGTDTDGWMMSILPVVLGVLLPVVMPTTQIRSVNSRSELLLFLVILSTASISLHLSPMATIRQALHAYLDPLLTKHSAGQPIVYEDLVTSWESSHALCQGNEANRGVCVRVLTYDTISMPP